MILRNKFSIANGSMAGFAIYLKQGKFAPDEGFLWARLHNFFQQLLRRTLVRSYRYSTISERIHEVVSKLISNTKNTKYHKDHNVVFFVVLGVRCVPYPVWKQKLSYS